MKNALSRRSVDVRMGRDNNALEILGRKLGDIGQTFVNLYDLLEVGLTEHPPKKTENK